MFSASLSVLITSHNDFMKMSKENKTFIDFLYKQEMWFLQKARVLKLLFTRYVYKT